MPNWLRNVTIFVILAILAYALVAHAAFQMVAAGVAIFLFGMLFMEQGFQALTGGILERILRRATSNIARSQFFGFAATALMQSSSLVTVLTISTLSAGLISLAAGIGIVFGANLGTTTGAWLIAGFGLKLDLAALAMPILTIGLVLTFSRRGHLKGAGNILAGVGFVFLGIHYMKEGFEVVSAATDLSRYAVSGFRGLVLYTLIGIVATVVMQSSHATLMITIAALAAGQVTYENALALAIGSNVGTTVTAVIGSLHANVEGKRLVYAHVLFNVITAVIALVLIRPFMAVVDGFAGLVGIGAEDWTLKLATFHSLFNVVGVAVMTPLMGRMVTFLERVVPGRVVARERGVVLEPQYLNESALGHPDAALEVLVKETEHLLENVFEVVAHGLNLHRTDILSGRDMDQLVAESREVMDIDILERYYGSVKLLYAAIIDYATRAPAEARMNTEQMGRVDAIRQACRDAAEIIKLLAVMRPNLNRYLNAENAEIREQYDKIRRTVGRALRRLYGTRDVYSGPHRAVEYAEIRAELQARDVLADGSLDRLVREGAIDAVMATSLMNDNQAAFEIGNRLTDIAEHMEAAEGPEPDGGG